ncbi:MAG: hypothetical protein O3C21_01500 [Verrucomicrobia bacterium]|nr:hypothetical protein [Verrucomicrobiota bacterium]
MSEISPQSHRILYCRCAYANTVPQGVKDEVLQRLSDAGRPFEAVSDLCEMSASRDPRLKSIAEGSGCVRIAACYPRAVKWLFHAAGHPLPEQGIEVVNMRELSGEEAAALLLDGNIASSTSSHTSSHA